MKETVISWTAPNFFTVGLMLILFSAVLGAAVKLSTKWRANSEG